MAQLIFLLGIVLLFFLYTIAKRTKFSFLRFNQQGDRKSPEKYITLLYQETSRYDFLKSQPLFFLDNEIEEEPNAERFSYRIAEAILNYLEVPFSSIRVVYTHKNETPNVVMNDIHGFDFYIPDDLKKSKGAIRSLIAYECTRIFLAFQGDTFATKVKNHHLTDYAVIFLGLGVVFLKDLEELIDLLRHIEPEFSFYTDLDDLLFLMAVYMFQRQVPVEAVSGHLPSYQMRKIQRAHHDLTKSSYQVLYKDAFDVNVRCQYCYQILRVPAGRKLRVTCSTCGSKFEVKT